MRGYFVIQKKCGIKNQPTAGKTVSPLSGLDEELFALESMEWIGEIFSTKGSHPAIDEKELPVSMEKVKNPKVPMVLNAIDAAAELVAAQIPIKDKVCEIKAIPELLKLLDTDGSTVTPDAIEPRLRAC
ncbi:MAG TPA: hypothetical protein H9700_08910 [Candidatus Eisenbergiella intestinipullorum]|nr:hypothetical protein [Candidatus Eisenbergiella intestinipullorum]